MVAALITGFDQQVQEESSSRRDTAFLRLNRVRTAAADGRGKNASQNDDVEDGEAIKELSPRSGPHRFHNGG